MCSGGTSLLQSGYLSAVLYGFGALASFAAGFWLVVQNHRSTKRPVDEGQITPDEGCVFLLRDGELAHSNFFGRRQLDGVSNTGEDKQRLHQLIGTWFNEVDTILAPPEQVGDASEVSCDGLLQIIREVAGNEVRIEILSRETSSPGSRDIHSRKSEYEELQMLRNMARFTPFHLWRQSPDGSIVWANRNYLDAARDIFGVQRVETWPIPKLFPDLDEKQHSAGSQLIRLKCNADPKGESGWFDCHRVEVDGDILWTAYRSDEAVRSETRRREFTQTLTKTFSDLAIGLAIFDRSRRMALFNPALTDLTSLPVDFLSTRPSLIAFLDRLRENRVMQEPRDYRAWRKSISDLESGAMDGTYSETWSLPDGQTYRVSGRPHPDGAMALLFEDITAEMALTRRFRAQIEQSQAIIDALDDAVAIFSSSGELAFANAAYRNLWHDQPGESVQGCTIVEATRKWHERTAPTPIWGDFRDFAFQETDRSEWSANASMRDGRSLTCRFVPQKAGSCLVVFRVQAMSQRFEEDLRQAI